MSAIAAEDGASELGRRGAGQRGAEETNVCAEHTENHRKFHTRGFLGLPRVYHHWEVLLPVGKPAVAAV